MSGYQTFFSLVFFLHFSVQKAVSLTFSRLVQLATSLWITSDRERARERTFSHLLIVDKLLSLSLSLSLSLFPALARSRARALSLFLSLSFSLSGNYNALSGNSLGARARELYQLSFITTFSHTLPSTSSAIKSHVTSPLGV